MRDQIWIDMEHARERVDLRSGCRGVRCPGVKPQSAGGQIERERAAITIDDASPGGWQFDVADLADFSLVLVEVVFNALYPRRAADQGEERTSEKQAREAGPSTMKTREAQVVAAEAEVFACFRHPAGRISSRACGSR